MQMGTVLQENGPLFSGGWVPTLPKYYPSHPVNPMKNYLLLVLTLFGPLLVPRVGQADESTGSHRQAIQLLQSRCAECHGPSQQKGGFRVDGPKTLFEGGDSGEKGIVAGKPGESAVLLRIMGAKGKQMPPKGPPLPEGEIKLIREWIGVGGPWPVDFQPAQKKTHWAFQNPKRPPLPEVSDPLYAKNPIDRFLFNSMAKAGLKPSSRADKSTLIRRVALDLTGLPPTPEQVRGFLADTRPDAFGKMVDTFLALPAYGERMARPWLDLARYADSKGFGSDPLRLYIWRYRDWVINAYNRNLPYDRFTIEQLAGDLLPGATTEQILATAFHRNTMTNTEGGTDNEEFRIAAVKDRVDTTMQVWMGLTAGCAKCHSHKFDPLTQREYYQIFAIFNQTEDADNDDDLPRIPTPTDDQVKRLAELDAKINALVTKGKATPKPTPEFTRWLLEVEKAPSYWTSPKVISAKATGGLQLEGQTDGSLKAIGPVPQTSKFEVNLENLPKGTTGLRIEALADVGAKNKGPGLAVGGNFVLSHLEVSAKQPKAPLARFVRLRHAKDQFLHVAEVEVFSGKANLALKGKASQSTTGFNGPANLAIDGNTNGDHSKGSVTHNAEQDPDPWWQVDLGGDFPVDKLVVHNRTDGGTYTRLAGAVLELRDSKNSVIWQKPIEKPTIKPMVFNTIEGSVLALNFATATVEQGSGFIAKAALEKNPKIGWAIGGHVGTNQTLAVQFNEPLAQGSGPVRLSFDCNFGDQHILGRFRILATTQPNPAPAVDPKIIKAARENPTLAPQKLVDLWWDTKPESKGFAKDIELLNQSRNALNKEIVTTPILKELAKDKQRKTKILIKGNFLQPGEEVDPKLPGAFAKGLENKTVNRLDFAHWFVSPENPLTSRVAVNRHWALIFGRGLVETEEDFGTMGQAPSHPELLDWLAVEFREKGWDTKALLRLILSSEAYAQSSATTPEHLQKDPNNLFLARAPRYRLEAESIRDQALAISGLLSPKMLGPSVYPPQPGGLWQAAFNGERTYPTSLGEESRRRGLYTIWRRTVPHPSMQAFDAPSRESCTIRRVASNTPLQAFVTLNDPNFVAAAHGLADRMIGSGGDHASRLRFGWFVCTAREATAEEFAALESLYLLEKTRFKANPEETKKFLQGLAANPAADPSERAAFGLVANILLNLDTVLTRN